MVGRKLGRLNRIDLRDVWASEAYDFTPWLARDENLAVLGDTLALDLELEAQEKSVGPFRADILCKDMRDGSWVLVENQLERTDHVHLGQLLTYASGLQAVTIVWIAARFTEEHRSTLDWLNKITDDSFRFFGLEVELWQIGDSQAAPKFNVVSKPNDWSRSVARAAKAIDDSELSELRLLQRDYWQAFNQHLEQTDGPFKGNKKPPPRSWMTLPIGKSGMRLAAVTNKTSQTIRAELYLVGQKAKAHFSLLEEQKDAIHSELGFELSWEQLPDRQDCRIAAYRFETNPSNQGDWANQHRWLASKLGELHTVFSKRVQELTVDDTSI